jgi:hypothetical protein
MKLPRQRREPRIQEDDEAAGEGIGRILALSDGVFAIAITLLVIQIALPATAGAADLPSALLRLWPRYLAYALSFLVIARFWVSHHLAFRLITRYDSTLVWLNLVLLMFVAFLPFPQPCSGSTWRRRPRPSYMRWPSASPRRPQRAIGGTPLAEDDCSNRASIGCRSKSCAPEACRAQCSSR